MDSPVFFIGCSRTGSKIYPYILNKYTEIDVVPEIWLLCPKWLHMDLQSNIKKYVGNLNDDANIVKLVDLMYAKKNFGSFWKNIDKSRIDKSILNKNLLASDRSLKGIFNALLKTSAEANGKKRYGAKFPVYLSYTEKLTQWYPNCRIVHTMRDPRAIYSSQNKKHFREDVHPFKNKWTYFLHFIFTNISFKWAVHVHKKMKSNPNYFMSKYEDLIQNPESQLKKLCKFLNINFEGEMLYPPVIDSSHGRGDKNLNHFDKASLNAWKTHLHPLIAKLFILFNYASMKTMGY